MAKLGEGTKVISLQGETGKTVASDQTFTGPNALGFIDEAVDLPGGDVEYVITFDGDVTKRISEADLFDPSRYGVLVRD
ncbi:MULTISPECIES: hypothetical protein [unclassified Burkholderia]|uniref:hypothetical protein n=1 Tax=unclassified Burkholderia TaxID=2613784 RepID=UPI002AAF0A9D|nr:MULTISPECIES: hypothetical protein [unclassified Burkholderia]